MQADRTLRMRQIGAWLFGGPRLRMLGGENTAGALLAPSAMLAGAIGLTLLWSLSGLAGKPVISGLSADALSALYPRFDAPVSAPPPSATEALVSAAQAHEQAIGAALDDLGAPKDAVRDASLPAVASGMDAASAGRALATVQAQEETMIRDADAYARQRVEHLRHAYGIAGVNWRAFSAGDLGESSVSFSSAEFSDARLLAARFDVSRGLAWRMQRVARNLVLARALKGASAILPFGLPADHVVKSSNYGLRIDPFTGEIRFHPGVDFAGRFGQDIHSTAPGIVVFAGRRSGYGNCVEVDHGGGLKTRYGHMSAIAVSVGQRVAGGQTIGAMGSTGRSTGVHVHYEIWRNGRLTDPMRFIMAAAEVQRALAS